MDDHHGRRCTKQASLTLSFVVFDAAILFLRFTLGSAPCFRRMSTTCTPHRSPVTQGRVHMFRRSVVDNIIVFGQVISILPTPPNSYRNLVKNRDWLTSGCPRPSVPQEARCSGVSPSPSQFSMFAPASISPATTAECPSCAARCMGAVLFAPIASKSAPALTRACPPVHFGTRNSSSSSRNNTPS